MNLSKKFTQEPTEILTLPANPSKPRTIEPELFALGDGWVSNLLIEQIDRRLSDMPDELARYLVYQLTEQMPRNGEWVTIADLPESLRQAIFPTELPL